MMVKLSSFIIFHIENPLFRVLWPPRPGTTPYDQARLDPPRSRVIYHLYRMVVAVRESIPLPQ